MDRLRLYRLPDDQASYLRPLWQFIAARMGEGDRQHAEPALEKAFDEIEWLLTRHPLPPQTRGDRR